MQQMAAIYDITGKVILRILYGWIPFIYLMFEVLMMFHDLLVLTMLWISEYYLMFYVVTCMKYKL